MIPSIHSLSFLCIFGFFFASPAFPLSPRYQAVTGFDLNRYLGKWYEIARLPNSFEKDLVYVTATYSLRGDGKVRVLNRGYKKTKDGKHALANGKAKFKSRPDIGHLRVSFFGPFYADYIIVALDSDYKYALVASSPKYLWILSREPRLSQDVLDSLIIKSQTLGFDTDKLYYTPQEW
ncbi:MAG: lipocalin family protein [Candidatus Latescibacterota bacterium]